MAALGGARCLRGLRGLGKAAVKLTLVRAPVEPRRQLATLLRWHKHTNDLDRARCCCGWTDFVILSSGELQPSRFRVT